MWSNVFMIGRLAGRRVDPGPRRRRRHRVDGHPARRGPSAPACWRPAGSAEKLALCAELGAQVTIDYQQQDFVAEVQAATDGHGADVILDNMGASYLARNVEALATEGRLLVIGLHGRDQAASSTSTS